MRVCACARVRACVHVCACVRACVCVCVCLMEVMMEGANVNVSFQQNAFENVDKQFHLSSFLAIILI